MATRKKTGMQRMTRQRSIILETVRALSNHPTADDIYKRVRRKMPRISLGTVYRNLELLAQEGLIQRLNFGYNQNHFDMNTRKHYHIRCQKCGRLADVPAGSVDVHSRAILHQTGYRFLDLDVEFTGVCPQCQALHGNKGEDQ